MLWTMIAVAGGILIAASILGGGFLWFVWDEL